MSAAARTLPSFDVMRYQRLSPDYLTLSNGRKPSMRSKEDNNHFDTHGQTQTYSTLEKKLPRIKSISPSSYPYFSLSTNPSPAGTSPASTAPSPQGLFHHENNGCRPACGDVLLQWGHSKRPRCSRSDSRHAGYADSSGHQSNGFKLPRRCSMSSTSTTGHGTTQDPSPPEAANLAVRSKDRGDTRSLPSLPDKICPNKMDPAASPSRIGSVTTAGESESARPGPADPHGGDAGAEKVKTEQIELPRIYVPLSRKEKEEDFFAMKGTKLPQRPKKRAKNIDRSLQYCFPGMWLYDLSRARYEVREKKSVKKKRRGLKRMDIIDSGDSE